MYFVGGFYASKVILPSEAKKKKGKQKKTEIRVASMRLHLGNWLADWGEDCFSGMRNPLPWCFLPSFLSADAIRVLVPARRCALAYTEPERVLCKCSIFLPRCLALLRSFEGGASCICDAPVAISRRNPCHFLPILGSKGQGIPPTPLVLFHRSCACTLTGFLMEVSPLYGEGLASAALAYSRLWPRSQVALLLPQTQPWLKTCP